MPVDEEMALLAKCSSCKHEDPSYIPRTFVKMLDVVVCVIPVLGVQTQAGGWSSPSSQLAYVVSARPVKTLPKTKKKWTVFLRNDIRGHSLCPPHTCTYVHLHTEEHPGSRGQKLYGGSGSSWPLTSWYHHCLVSRNHLGTEEIV